MLFKRIFLKKYLYLFLIMLLTISSLFSISIKAQEDEKSTIQIKAGELNSKDGTIFLNEDLRIIRDEITLKSPEGEFEEEEEVLTLTKGVNMEYEYGAITSEKMTGHFSRDDFIFEDNVKMNYNAKEENEKGEKKKFDLESSYLEINSETNSFMAEEDVTINYDDRVIKGNIAEYDNQNEILIVKEKVYIQEENGDWIRSDRAEFNLSTGEEDFKALGNVEIEIGLKND